MGVIDIETAPITFRGIVARMERLPVTGTHQRVRLIASSSNFFDGFDAASVAFVLPVLLGLWHLSPAQVGYMISAGFLGQIVGALIFGSIADRYGRIPAMVWSISLFSLMSLACAFAWDYESLLVFRIIQGIGLGGEIPVCAAYVAEMARAHRRGYFFLIFQGIYGIGILVAAAIATWLVPAVGWQLVFVIGALPAVLALVARRTLPESARWLATKGRLVEADKRVRDLEAEAIRLGHALPAISDAVVPAVEPPPKARVSELFKGIYLRRTFLIWPIWFCSFFVSSIAQWMPSLYRVVFHLDVGTSLRYALITQVAGTLAAILVAFPADRVGRRRFIALAFAGAAVAFSVLGFISTPILTIVIICATIGYFSISFNAPLLVLYAAELYPARMRAIGGSVATIWWRLGQSAGPALVGLMISGYGISGIALVFAGVAAMGALVCVLFAVESSGRVLEELSP
jgi:MFS transporter, putative metabolite:H+ symporter